LAKLNGQEVSFEGQSIPDICDTILDASPTKDGGGVKLTLTPQEIIAFDVMANGIPASGLNGIRVLADLLGARHKERMGSDHPGSLVFSGSISTGECFTSIRS